MQCLLTIDTLLIVNAKKRSFNNINMTVMKTRILLLLSLYKYIRKIANSVAEGECIKLLSLYV